MNWNEYYAQLCLAVANKSKDPRVKVGAILLHGKSVVLSGFNGFPVGVKDDPELLSVREQKIQRIVHAEANIIALAAREGIATKAATLWVTHHPCNECAKLIIQAGIKEVVYLAEIDGYCTDVSADMFKQANVIIRKWEK